MKAVQCPEKMGLTSAYQEATQIYSDAVAALNRNIGICAKERYDLFYRGAEAARKNAAIARESLAKHIEMHHCG
jgi:hypothetical protein